MLKLALAGEWGKPTGETSMPRVTSMKRIPIRVSLRRVATTVTAETRRSCVWCGKRLLPGQAVLELAGRTIHDGGNCRDCRAEFDTLLYGGTD